MKQFLLFTALMVGSLTLVQAQKLGHLDAQNILLNLPERAEAQSQIEMQAGQYEQEMMRMQEDLQTRYADYQGKAETWPAAIREQKERELQALDQGLQEFGATVQNELAAAEQELLLPMIERVRQAIEEVGAENGFTYIFDTSSGASVYNGGEDVSEKVKAKLGI